MHYYALVVSSLVFVFIESNYLKIFFSFILPTVVAVSSLLFFSHFVPLDCFFDHCFLSSAVTDSISVSPHRYCFLSRRLYVCSRFLLFKVQCLDTFWSAPSSSLSWNYWICMGLNACSIDRDGSSSTRAHLENSNPSIRIVLQAGSVTFFFPSKKVCMGIP